jgi:hypothetical protein
MWNMHLKSEAGTMPLKVDHATLCVRELAPLQQAFAAAGLPTVYGGPHANGLTHMALLGFPDGSYLELIAPFPAGSLEASPRGEEARDGEARGTGAWGALMLADAGPGAWAVGAEDIQAEVRRLKALGIEATGPEAGKRRRPDGKLLEWQTASLGPGPPGAILPFLIQDLTPRAWRVQPSPAALAAGFTGIAAVVLGVHRIESASAMFRRAYAWDAPLLEEHSGFGARTAHFSGTPVILSSPLPEDSWLASRLAKFGEIPAAFLLHSANLDQSRERFRLSSVQNWFGHGVAWFNPDQLCGIRMGVIHSSFASRA